MINSNLNSFQSLNFPALPNGANKHLKGFLLRCHEKMHGEPPAWCLAPAGRACPSPITRQPGESQASGTDPWMPQSRAQLCKGTASSEKATASNPEGAFSQRPQNHHARPLADTCPAEQMGLTPPTHTNTSLETFSFLKAIS